MLNLVRRLVWLIRYLIKLFGQYSQYENVRCQTVTLVSNMLEIFLRILGHNFGKNYSRIIGHVQA